MAGPHEIGDSVHLGRASLTNERRHEQQPQPRLTPKRRSRIACLACRTRKVRCDAVQQEDAPCTNCRLDRETCIVQNRVRQSRTAHQQTFNLSTKSGSAAWSALRKTAAQKNTPSPTSDRGMLEDSERVTSRQHSQQHSQPQANRTGLEELVDRPIVSSMNEHSPPYQDRGKQNLSEDTVGPTDSGLSVYGSSTATHKADVGYFYYQFLVVEVAPQLPTEDVHYLESLSCFRVPLRPLIYELMCAYFRYVHPHLPILHEADFWETYTGSATSSGSKISLFVFQAMLSAACGFVPLSTIRKLGFDSIRSARTSFYRRAKALFDTETHKDVLSSAQGALLLTYYVSATDARVNTYWLSNAICFARLANAHVHQDRVETSAKRKSLKRLWWCCLVRDRIMSLALRRPVQISLEDSHPSLLEEGDFDGDNERSKVYSSLTKQELMASFIALCELVVVLADFLAFLFFREQSSSSEPARVRSQPQTCSDQADEWFERTKAKFRSFGHTDNSVVLHYNVIYIYYHASKAALWNHAIYISVTGRHPIHIRYPQSRTRLESALRGIDDSLNLIQDIGLTDCMPISIVAFVALPLVWHIISTKLSHGSDSRETRARLNVYFNAMSAFKVRSDGTDRVLNHIRQLVTCFQQPEDSLSNQESNNRLSSQPVPKINYWSDILMSQPQYFIRTSLTVELALSHGTYPAEDDFPSSLSSARQNGLSSSGSAGQWSGHSLKETPKPPSNCDANNGVFAKSNSPSVWTLGTSETNSDDAVDLSTQLRMQDALFRFEEADYAFFNSSAQYQSPSMTDAAYLNDLFSALEGD